MKFTTLITALFAATIAGTSALTIRPCPLGSVGSRDLPDCPGLPHRIPGAYIANLMSYGNRNILGYTAVSAAASAPAAIVSYIMGHIQPTGVGLGAAIWKPQISSNRVLPNFVCFRPVHGHPNLAPLYALL
ncbi:hypothetical protein BD779DRAFT_1469339 [Infundibulicybe gibba]|nr:hypothetical protein BD779DRAFT_1469339 [Infundibulicybe gibba]